MELGFMNNRRLWQGRLRRKLEREAFNEKYKCFICSKKERLQVHHLLYTGNEEDFFNPKYWRILCIGCHAKTPKGKKSKNKTKIFINHCAVCGKEMPLPYKRKYCDYCLLVHHFKWSHDEYVKCFGGRDDRSPNNASVCVLCDDRN